MGVIAAPSYYYCFYEEKLFLRKFIILLFFSQCTPLHGSAGEGHLDVCRFLVESNADVAARTRCFSPPPSHHLSLTICLAAMAKLHSDSPSTSTKPTLLHTCAASALLNDAPPRAAAAQIKAVLVRVSAAGGGGGARPSPLTLHRGYNI
jgi:ankyrin repeat protein